MAHPELTGAAEQRLEALPRRHALVMGGTGMLAGVARALARRGDAVTVVSRTGGVPEPGIAPAAVDYRDLDALDGALARAASESGPIELAVCWIHTDAPGAPDVVARRVAPGGLLVQLFGTIIWPLVDPPEHVEYRQVLLGSIAGRWLTHAEIAEGVLAALDRDAPVQVVGTRD